MARTTAAMPSPTCGDETSGRRLSVHIQYLIRPPLPGSVFPKNMELQQCYGFTRQLQRSCVNGSELLNERATRIRTETRKAAKCMHHLAFTPPHATCMLIRCWYTIHIPSQLSLRMKPSRHATCVEASPHRRSLRSQLSPKRSLDESGSHSYPTPCAPPSMMFAPY